MPVSRLTLSKRIPFALNEVEVGAAAALEFSESEGDMVVGGGATWRVLLQDLLRFS